jgi:DNA-binding MarR family transcriptional regulator
MERQGLLRKMDTAHDRRGVAVMITEEGRTLLRDELSCLIRARNCVNMATKCVNTLFLAQELGML